METGESGVQGHPQLHSKFETESHKNKNIKIIEVWCDGIKTVTPVLNLRQQDQEFEISIGYIVSLESTWTIK